MTLPGIIIVAVLYALAVTFCVVPLACAVAAAFIESARFAVAYWRGEFTP